MASLTLVPRRVTGIITSALRFVERRSHHVCASVVPQFAQQNNWHRFSALSLSANQNITTMRTNSLTLPLPLCQCSKLRRLSTDTNKSGGDVSKMNRKKAEKINVKEFKLKSSIGAHDLNIKFNQMRILLEKGKTIHIVMRVSRNAENFKNEASAFHKTISTDFKELCSVRQEYQNDTAAKFILTPLPKQDSQEES